MVVAHEWGDGLGVFASKSRGHLISRFRRFVLLSLSGIVLGQTARAVAEDPSLAAMTPEVRETFSIPMEWGDRDWDTNGKFLIAQATHQGPKAETARDCSVRALSWYALGLFLRNGKTDNARAIDVLNVVLAQQYTEPGKPWNGTFRVSPTQPEPPAGAVMWKDYDPNWREFIGTTFAMILEDFPDRIPRELQRKLDNSIAQAVAGEILNDRLKPAYTNPALMFGFLLDFAGVRSHRPDWVAQAAAWQAGIYTSFNRFGAFDEYNSPTYSGVDLFALGLWRSYGSTASMRDMGAQMEAALWRDLAAHYNANLKNVSGPFDRAYGMNMQSYVSVVGVALRLELGEGLAPIPKIEPGVDHGGDLWYATHFAILGVRIPPDAMLEFRSFREERLIEQRITEDRVATAWIGNNAIYGGEATQKSKDVDSHSQFHPATVQWKLPSGEIGWIQLTQAPPIDVRADHNGLQISCTGDVTFRIHAPGMETSDLKKSDWVLPGLAVHVTSDAGKVTLDQETGFVDITYSAISGMNLRIVPSP